MFVFIFTYKYEVLKFRDDHSSKMAVFGGTKCLLKIVVV